MAKLHYVTPMSLDGYIGDGDYEWSGPIGDAKKVITDIIRPMNTYLYGRRNFETMSVWETPEVMGNLGADDHEFARVWQAAEKIVFSRTLKSVSTKNTRLERDFNPAMIRDLKVRSSNDLCIGGPNLVTQAMLAGLVDEYHFFVVPVTIGGGIPIMPRGHSIKLNLEEERRFADGWMYLRYRTRS